MARGVAKVFGAEPLPLVNNIRCPNRSRLLVGQFQKRYNIQPQNKETYMNNSLELMPNHTHLKRHQHTHHNGTTKHRQKIINNLDNLKVQPGLNKADHQKAFLIKRLFPEQVEHQGGQEEGAGDEVNG